MTVHGHRRAYVKTGSGPALVLLHGAGDDHRTWDGVIHQLAEHYTVIAPDMLGHGQSDKPRADYSFGGFANGVRDLLTILGVDTATIVGHSLGGAVAMQFAYQFPERTERLVLVGSGGLGTEITPLIKAVGLPGFGLAAEVMTAPGIRHALQLGLTTAGRTIGRGNGLQDLEEVAHLLEKWRDPAALRALRHIVRNGIDFRGQVITHKDRAYLARAVPVAIVWGTDDHMVPVEHARDLEKAMPEGRVLYIEGAGHFPHLADPESFTAFLTNFIDSTEPAVYSRSTWRSILMSGGRSQRLRPVPAQYERAVADGA